MKNNVSIVLLLVVNNVFGQLSVSNILEYQVGNLPNEEPTNQTTHFDQLSLSYRYNEFLITGRFEHFQNATMDISYNQIRQWSLSFNKENLDLLVGHFYEILGRGLLLRTYEIPGVIREQAGLRTRYGFYRDINGVKLGYENKWIEFTAFRGRVLREDLPPTISNEIRRQDLLEAAQVSFFVADWTITTAYLRQNQQNEYREFANISLAANLPLNMQIYGEYAGKLTSSNRFINLDDESSHALYLSLNTYLGPAGLSVEYKDYNDFFLGFNDPPPLVKEHEYTLLNRSTHSLEPNNETGYQVELFYNLGTDLSITANISEAKNKTIIKDFDYNEKFFELGYYFSPEITVKGFFDIASEDIRLEKNRQTYGIYIETEWIPGLSTTLDVEHQDFIRELGTPNKVTNQLASLSISYAPDFSAGVTIERSTDPGEQRNEWIGFNAGYQYSQEHLINVFYGKRRGGNACTAGVCYQVLPFEGFELRLTSNL